MENIHASNFQQIVRKSELNILRHTRSLDMFDGRQMTINNCDAASTTTETRTTASCHPVTPYYLNCYAQPQPNKQCSESRMVEPFSQTREHVSTAPGFELSREWKVASYENVFMGYLLVPVAASKKLDRNAESLNPVCERSDECCIEMAGDTIREGDVQKGAPEDIRECKIQIIEENETSKVVEKNGCLKPFLFGFGLACLGAAVTVAGCLMMLPTY